MFADMKNSCTFATAFEKESNTNKEFFEKFQINKQNVVQFLFKHRKMQNKEKTVKTFNSIDRFGFLNRDNKRYFYTEDITRYFTKKSLILAQDERQLQA